MSDYVSNKQVYREFNQQGQALVRNENRYFVERQEDGAWKPVEPSDRFVSADELGRDFGLWKDERITKGILFWKKEIRPKDGIVQQDEVVTMASVMKQQHDSPVPGGVYPNGAYHDYDRLLPLNTELSLTSDGGVLKTEWQTRYRHCEHALSVLTNDYLV